MAAKPKAKGKKGKRKLHQHHSTPKLKTKRESEAAVAQRSNRVSGNQLAGLTASKLSNAIAGFECGDYASSVPLFEQILGRDHMALTALGKRKYDVC